MSSAALSFEEHLEAIEREAARLVEAADGRLDVPVPSCPDWTAGDLVDHMAHVLAFWREQLIAGDVSDRREPSEDERESAEDGPDPVEWLHDRSTALLTSLGDLGPDAPCWNWSGHDLDAGWVARRMALELAVHRYDGELAAGDPSPVEARLAGDGLDERIMVHLRLDVPEVPTATLGGSICLACDDVPVAFVVEVGGGRLHVREGAAPASAFLRGPASDVFLFSWNRVGLEHLQLTGDHSVAEAWASLPV